MDALILACALLAVPEPVSERDLLRFPDFQHSWDSYKFHERHMSWIFNQVKIQAWQRGELIEVYWKSHHVFECWDRLADAQDKKYEMCWRMDRLNQLRDLLTEEEWIMGQMPLLPIRCFGRIE